MTISILGCGWLGFPLAKTLLDKGFSVKGSVTSLEKLTLLKSAGINTFQIEIWENEINGDTVGFLEDSDILIIAVPPKAGSSDFTKKLSILIPFIENSGLTKVIFISSTSVYGDEEPVVTELTAPNPVTDSGRKLKISEQILRKNRFFKTTIIRFGGLIGEDRHPVKYLSGKMNENPDSPINLIHQDDCIGIISKTIELDIFGETFNAVAPFHPSRNEYYTQKALQQNLPLPRFEPQQREIGKIISSEKIEKVLSYHFIHHNL